MLLAASETPVLPPGYFPPQGVTYIAPKSGCRTVPSNVPYCGGISTTATQHHIEILSYILSKHPSNLVPVISRTNADGPITSNVCLTRQCTEDIMRLLCTSLNGWYVNRYTFNRAEWAEDLHEKPHPGLWERIRMDATLTGLRSVSKKPTALDGDLVTTMDGEFLLPTSAAEARYCADGYHVQIEQLTGETQVMPGTSHGDVMVKECMASCLDTVAAITDPPMPGESSPFYTNVQSRPNNLCFNPLAFFQDFESYSFDEKFSGAGDVKEMCYGRTRRFTETLLVTFSCTTLVNDPNTYPCRKLVDWASKKDPNVTDTQQNVEFLHQEAPYIFMSGVQSMFNKFKQETDDDAIYQGGNNRVDVGLPRQEHVVVKTVEIPVETNMLTFYPFGDAPPSTFAHHMQVLFPIAYDTPIEPTSVIMERLTKQFDIETVLNTPVHVLNSTVPSDGVYQYYQAIQDAMRYNGVPDMFIANIANDAQLNQVAPKYLKRAKESAGNRGRAGWLLEVILVSNVCIYVLGGLHR